MKSTLHNTAHKTPNFHSFCSTISHFQDIAQIFPLTSMLKFQSATTFLILASDRQNIYNVTFPYDGLILRKVWLKSDKNCRSSVLKFPAPYGLVLTKNSKCHKIFFADRQSIYIFLKRFKF